MPRKVFDASRMASRQASSNPFGDCAMTSILRTIDIGLSSHTLYFCPRQTRASGNAPCVVWFRLRRRIEKTLARGGGGAYRLRSARRLPIDRHHSLPPGIAQPALQPPFQIENLVGWLQPKPA